MTEDRKQRSGVRRVLLGCHCESKGRSNPVPLILVLILFFVAHQTSCRSCKKEKEPEVTVSSAQLILQTKGDAPEDETVDKGPKIRRIEIGPSKRESEESPAEVQPTAAERIKEAIASLPPNTFEESDLTERLRDKLADAYGSEEDVPDVKIYVSEMKYDQFIDYYKKLGYKTKTVAVPATQIIEPVLAQRPELIDKINLADYENVIIHQVMIDEAGISAADKYIDPDTFEVVEKTFVTKMNK